MENHHSWTVLRPFDILERVEEHSDLNLILNSATWLPYATSFKLSVTDFKRP